MEKLEKLLGHWKEHNMEHAETYREWAETTARLGRQNLSDILTRLYNDAKAMEKLFDEAAESIK
ncbi:MAG: hypothetical protein HQL09_07950 [Nitrospirae bacterium]|nr:hypothetical protein [Nitrospirota bacterium]